MNQGEAVSSDNMAVRVQLPELSGIVSALENKGPGWAQVTESLILGRRS